MTVQPIIFFPDQRLKQICAPVIEFDNALRTLTVDLLDTLRAAPGIGITAPHIGINQRVVLLDLPQSNMPEIYINPEITWLSDNKKQNEEGSISMPGVSAPVERSVAIRFCYTDLYGKEHTEEADGLRSICLQHEIDQINGIFWIQRLSALRRTRLLTRYKKYITTNFK